LGIYEPNETKVLSGIIRSRDVVIDKGERNNENVQKYAGDSTQVVKRMDSCNEIEVSKDVPTENISALGFFVLKRR